MQIKSLTQFIRTVRDCRRSLGRAPCRRLSGGVTRSTAHVPWLHVPFRIAARDAASVQDVYAQLENYTSFQMVLQAGTE